VVAQLVLPPLAENRAEAALTEDGGSADVDIAALPAVRLLLRDGDLVRVRAREVELPFVRPDERVLADLDGFNEVDIEVREATAGPFRFEQVTLTRRGDGNYRMTLHGSITASDLATFAGGQMGGVFGGLFGGLMGGALPFGDEPIPIDLNGTIRSDDGRPRAVVVHGTIAGVPAGPLVEAFAQALAGAF
jgi:hypothetical protein